METDPQALLQLDAAQLDTVATALGGLTERLSPLAAAQPRVHASVDSIAGLTQRVQDARQALPSPPGQAARARSSDERSNTGGNGGGEQREEHARGAATPPAAGQPGAPTQARSTAAREATATRAPRTPTPTVTAAPTVPASSALATRFPFCSDGPSSNVAGCQGALERATDRCTPAGVTALNREALGRCTDAIDSARRNCDRLQSRAADACRRQLDVVLAQAKRAPAGTATPTPTPREGARRTEDWQRNGD